jgi:serine/threonine-protein kinase
MRTRVEEIFHAVADLSEEARAGYFAERNVDATTRREVEGLMAFDSPTMASLDRDIGQAAQEALAQVNPKGLRCGPYRLGDLVGWGGMGTVYSAERVDGEVAQLVAVKLLRPGADDPQLLQRFLGERQILAALSHPNIAKLLDAGHREDGQPYLVMEYVEGKPIDVYTTGLGLRQKLKLFLKVCAAVSYLHRNLVVHRDLKPSNILVSSEGEPMLLDFGIAKMLGLNGDSTVTAARMLTPDYASPEQVTGGAITTASDIYSLGAMLYKLLTGVCPHQFEGHSTAAIALAISSGRIAPPSKLVPGLKSDLEIVLMKALRNEPQERYASVEHFSEDLENYLQSHPIRARKGDAWYRTRKFLRRYWLPVAAATFAFGGLSAESRNGDSNSSINYPTKSWI